MPIYTDDLETGVTLEQGGSALPDDATFRLLLLGDWSGRNSRANADSSTLRERRPMLIDRDNFEDVMRKLSITLNLDLQNDENPLTLRFSELDDFHPDRIFKQVPMFAELRDTRKRLMNSQTFNEAAREVRDWMGSDGENEKAVPDNPEPAETESPSSSDSLLDQILSGARGAPVKAQPTSSSELNSLLGDLVRPYLVQTDEAEQSKLVNAVDLATGELMRTILHQPQFKALESAWRGAYLAVMRTETDTDLKIYLLDATKDELKADLKSVNNLTDSGFYKLLNEKTVGMADDDFWAAVCADYVFGPNVDDIAALMRIIEAASRARTPFIAQASPEILGVKSLAETPDSRDWRPTADTTKLWTMLRELPEAAYLGLTISRLMARMPYGEKSEPTEAFSFEELSTPAKHEEYLWTNGPFACALLLAQSFRANEWEMGQSLQQEIENLPMHLYQEDGETKIKPGAELVMTLTAAEKILELGLMPLLSFRDSDRVRLGRFQSIGAAALRGRWT